ncbi:hypothetical protein [Candidatus Rhabdochlamydia oedothoracis]|nr:hypothetical protein [Candidatus Rhabdochlamydia oedothoracis]
MKHYIGLDVSMKRTFICGPFNLEVQNRYFFKYLYVLFCALRG